MPELSSAQPASRRRRWIGIALVIAVLALLAWVLFKPSGQNTRLGRGGPGGPPSLMPMATPVKVAQARSQDVDIILRALGTVTAYNTVTVRSQVSGELIKVAFKEGQMVQAGDLLAQVDPRPFEVALAQAQGQQQQNLAQLENARRDLQRYQTLFKQDSIARQQLDTQAALVRQYEGVVKSNQAAVDAAKLNLAYSRITAPISGRLGLRQVDQGNLVSSSDANGLVVITQTQPISVVFTLPETQLPQVLEQVRAGKTLTVEAYDRADTRKLATGVLETIDNQIDVATGTVKLKARFENADQSLFPNQFVNVRLLVETRSGVTTIPMQAVQQGSVGAFVFQVLADDTVEVKPVKLGAVNGNWVAVNEGLSPGDRVVIEGTDRLRAGSKVQVITPAEPAAAAAKPASQPRRQDNR
ncbi:MdtA/MuxA family multidrug efflux RND transporter periplasmic adaptor subunit [Bordetella avium]|uniref:MdtA/MuxA family multidrug efflux RND transporter periplasmic adaptor subunit n=1 Tax=Bordetella avium TaxID=521 RepID=UPI000E0BB081|nr:MdtA/MuxA family multidrug efflux RND transporter periplasmic adaptor subunit [Bordetella avium]RIQ15638.1 MdtA/MuxA family multidrug efflux RND transporter periplasmic adaptor subunit [Bordetella avium]RIQ38441.1 MdtA/MuxA family multidrug efflux RND transporter periplasmic adaptor subunit [Bordetella avium]RIQ43350.1 MdtA/MuxA family multidrug efflux RND transporter periplasmic adaptor subunit [Bordetella avium]RIQ44086.1 MdtA/MuxA family multidrug efflux RND transporter periplasmic adapto